MDWINYHHLLYFWTVAREGSIARACEQLHLTQPTISGQLRKLEQAVGGKLYERAGREIALTDLGQMVFRYADEIFTVGRELMDAVRGQSTGRRLRLRVGVPDYMPKLIVYRLLAPAFALDEPVQVVCTEGKMDRLLAQLAVHELDVVLADSPAGSMVRIRSFNHPLGECDVAFYGTTKLKKKYKSGFPDSLNEAPILLPTENTTLRRSIDHWLISQEVHPDVVGEFEDTALMKVFGEAGLGLVPAPTVIEAEISHQFGLEIVEIIPQVREQFYAITVERKLRHPAVVAISASAREDLFHVKPGLDGEQE